MKQIPMLNLQREYEYMKGDIDTAIRTCLEHQRWIMGPEVEELEGAIARFLDCEHCIGISSGTDALTLSLRALAISSRGQEHFEKKDEIITTPFTFTATGDAILRSGATPVFADIDPVTYNIDHGALRKYLGSGHGSVIGIIPVHLYGLACDMDEVMDIAREFDLFVLEDVAQAFGGAWGNNKLGSIGTAGAFSFFPSKNLGGFGDGGMVATDHEEIAGFVRMLLRHGGKDKYNVDHIGYNARLDTLQAAVLLAKLAYIDEFNEKRRRIADHYNEGLKGVDGLVLPGISEGSSGAHPHHVYHQYTVRVVNGGRDELQRYLKENGVASMLYYPIPLNNMKVFKGRCKMVGELGQSEQAAREVLSLPIEPLMEEEEIVSVIRTVGGFFEKSEN